MLTNGAVCINQMNRVNSCNANCYDHSVIIIDISIIIIIIIWSVFKKQSSYFTAISDSILIVPSSQKGNFSCK